ncbi:Glyoxalase superfamily enzyme, possibly 3-demethylubiquinone-9 3-methyltransferase [Halobacillus karajensis]|uniref:3-demethylubiquinone-9 3-methyltransferase n=1 Tax=Halobacillus karajensis TaxID=195088 RepID=A0A059NXG1_9BACI|nr:3-demethylubiquinone-9 3-methyltransferase [Halobacillus karajensis]CDQ23428.1 3-demethylubiquinone-9 3-methyltransferase [Halobacillus karajensis]CDQ26910.1 3-demethylubiquinone-9 3-methyltransferase [Halobacillus karajensis]SEH50654.1 Glyoxalase superfamily enzyme, possibly 3-demethylubiquinone-9 3-methyltransferase [Halobacillus karajensis]
MGSIQKITPNFWFDYQAEEAAKFYTSIFQDSEIIKVSRYMNEGKEIHGKDEGTVMTVDFQLEGQRFVALNGGPQFKFNEAISFIVHCANQEEVDYFWEKLSEGGDESAQQCGWLKDTFGVSWQIVPDSLQELLNQPDPVISEKVMKAMLQMKKIDINALKEVQSRN